MWARRVPTDGQDTVWVPADVDPAPPSEQLILHGTASLAAVVAVLVQVRARTLCAFVAHSQRLRTVQAGLEVQRDEGMEPAAKRVRGWQGVCQVEVDGQLLTVALQPGGVLLRGGEPVQRAWLAGVLQSALPLCPV